MKKAGGRHTTQANLVPWPEQHLKDNEMGFNLARRFTGRGR